MKFKVTMVKPIRYYAFVEAKSKEEAEEKAIDVYFDEPQELGQDIYEAEIEVADIIKK